MRGLFLSATSKGNWAAQKMGELQRLCALHSVVILQETHGVGADLESLRRDIPEFDAFGCFHDQSDTGGVVTLVRKTLLRRASSHQQVDIVQGRCMIIDIQVGDITFQVINLHVDPKAPIAIKKSLFEGIKQRLANPAAGFALMGGDFNFDPYDEPRARLDEVDA